MPRYYKFAVEPMAFESLWRGYPRLPAQAAQNRSGLADVTDRSEFFAVPASKDPYRLHKRRQRLPFFYVPRKDRPYYLHKQRLDRSSASPLGIIPGVSDPISFVVGAALGAAGLAAFQKWKRR